MAAGHSPARAHSYEIGGPFLIAGETGDNAVVSGDFNGDRRTDLAFCQGGKNVIILTQGHDGSFDRHFDASVWSPLLPGWSVYDCRMNIADLNADGIDDIILTHSLGITSLISNGAGGFDRSEIDVGVQVSGDMLKASALIDVDEDGDLDLVVYSKDGRLRYWPNDGSGHLGTEKLLLQIDVGYGGLRGMAVGDFDSDGRIDIVFPVHRYFPEEISLLRLFRNVGGGAFVELAPITFPAGAAIDNAAIGDVNGDGRNDIVVTHKANNPAAAVVVLLQGNDGTFGDFQAYATADLPASILIVDIDGDGLNDVVINHPGWMRVTTYLQGPTYLELQPSAHWVGSNLNTGQVMAAGDFNSDGCTDIVVATGGAAYYLLYGTSCHQRHSARPTPEILRQGERLRRTNIGVPSGAGVAR
jgi:hypothetical protein